MTDRQTDGRTDRRTGKTICLPTLKGGGIIILFINPATCAPGVHTGHTRGQGSLAPFQVKLSRSGERLQDHWSSGYQRGHLTAQTKNNDHSDKLSGKQCNDRQKCFKA